MALEQVTPAGKRTVWNKKTGEERTVYNVDARDYLRKGEWVSHPDLLPDETKAALKAAGKEAGKPNKTVEEKAAEKEATSDDSDKGDNPNLTTWDSWTDDELVAKAKELKIRKAADRPRDKLIAAMEGKGAAASDDKVAAE